MPKHDNSGERMIQNNNLLPIFEPYNEIRGNGFRKTLGNQSYFIQSFFSIPVENLGHIDPSVFGKKPLS